MSVTTNISAGRFAARPDAVAASRVSWGAVLTSGFATAVAMWGLGFAVRLADLGSETTAAHVGSPALFIGLLIAMLFGGALAGRYGLSPWRDAALAGVIAGVVNLMIVGSVLKGESMQMTLRNAAIWVPGTLVASTALMTLGGLLGAIGAPARERRNWLGHFAKVNAFATLLLIMVGGTVTGFDAGLAVVDWPNTEGYFMFLYPLSKMTGGIYFEHAHRLIGSLVGLVTLVLAFYLHFFGKGTGLRWLGWTALALVIFQGVLGGLRVTGYLTWTTDPSATAPNLTYAIMHGILGQVFFGLLVFLAVGLSNSWQRSTATERVPAAKTERVLALLLCGVLVFQLALGAAVRHLMSEAAAVDAGWVSQLLTGHITFAIIVMLVAIAAGARAWGLYPHHRVLHRLGIAVLVLITVQLAFGLGAYAAVDGGQAAPGTASMGDVIVTTLHQTLGAVLLGLAVMLAAWSTRLLKPPAPVPQQLNAAPSQSPAK
jgi:heme A synthase